MKLKINVAPFKEIDNRWNQVKMLHPFTPRSYFACCVQGDIGYLHGGYNTDQGILSDMYTANFNDPDNRQWYVVQQKGKKLPGKLKGHTLTPYYCYLICVGGQKSQTENNQNIYKFNLKTKTWSIVEIQNRSSTVFQLKRDSHCSIIYNNNLYVFGGYLSDQAIYSNQLLKINLTGIESQNKVELSQVQFDNKIVPQPRGNFASCLFENSLFIFGGLNQYDTMDDFWKLSLNDLAWQQICKPKDQKQKQHWPQKRKGAVLVLHQESKGLIMFGGMQKITKQLNDVYIYLSQKNIWVRIHSNTNNIYDPSPTIKHQVQNSPTLINKINKRNSPKKQTFKIGLINIDNKNKDENVHKFQRNKTSQGGRKEIPLTKSPFSHNSIKTQMSFNKDKYSHKGNSAIFSKTQYTNNQKQHKMSVVQQKRYRQFLSRKKKLLSQIYVGYKGQKKNRPFSPTSQCLNYTLSQIGQQHQNEEKKNPQFNLPKVIFDDKKSVVIGKKPCARDGHSAIGVGHNMYIIGGDRHTVAFNDTHLLKMDKAIQSLNYYS